jgi:hypothetical protein
MEVVALIGLAAAGLGLARATNPSPANPVARKAIPVKESFQNTHTVERVIPTSLKGPAAELDLDYRDLMGKQPFPSMQLQPITSATPDVMMNPHGHEKKPNYLEGEFLTSGLSGQQLKSSEFTHNNMQPFFGGRVKQNVDVESGSSRLDRYTGSGATQVRKKEVEQMFDNTQQPFGNVYGLEIASDFVQSRINESRSRAGEKPFEPVKVAPGVGEGFSSTGKGGFQQIEVNELMMKNMKKTDDLRVETNPKLTYEMPVIQGQRFVANSAESAGEVRKYRPDAFFIDTEGKLVGAAGPADIQKEANRPMQVMPDVTRPETSVYYTGPGSGQEFGSNYVAGSYRKPMHNQYSGAGYRNADGSQYSSSTADDYGKSSYEARPNERYYTTERVVGLNLSPAEAGAVTTHFEDESRPTRRSETIGNIAQSGNATGYASSAPALTVWDPSDIARTTVREGTIKNDRFGIMAIGDGPTRLSVYDPDDIARPTQKAQISAKSDYIGGPKAAHERSMNHTFAYNMRLNESKQKAIKRPNSMGGNIAIFKGDELNVTSKKLDVDIKNDRALTVNRSLDFGASSADIGQVKYRAPPKLDVSAERNGREIIEQTQNNPLMQSLHVNAQKDHDNLYNQPVY